MYAWTNPSGPYKKFLVKCAAPSCAGGGETFAVLGLA